MYPYHTNPVAPSTIGSSATASTLPNEDWSRAISYGVHLKLLNLPYHTIPILPGPTELISYRTSYQVSSSLGRRQSQTGSSSSAAAAAKRERHTCMAWRGDKRGLPVRSSLIVAQWKAKEAPPPHSIHYYTFWRRLYGHTSFLHTSHECAKKPAPQISALPKWGLEA